MTNKKTLLIIAILVAVAAVQFWITGTNASQMNGQSLQQSIPILAFERAVIDVVEPNAGETAAIALNVMISSAPEQAEGAQVMAKTANGNALAGVDYLPLSETLTFPAASTVPQSFEVLIIGNNIHQPDRVFVAFLTNSVNAEVGIPAAVSIRILDNDEEARNFIPIISGFVAGPTRTPMPPTPCYGYECLTSLKH